MNKEYEFRDNRTHFLAHKAETSNGQIIKKTEQVNPAELLDKTDRVEKKIEYISQKTQTNSLVKQLQTLKFFVNIFFVFLKKILLLLSNCVYIFVQNIIFE